MKMTANKIRQVQRALKSKGYYLDGKIDGDWGPKTENAIIQFKRSIGFRARAFIGPLTWGALMEGRHAPVKLTGSEPSWLRVARSYINLREYRGKAHNKKILSWWSAIGMGGVKDDETAWCAAFVGGVLVEDGLPSTKSGLARSYDKWGKGLSKPAVGSVVTFWRSSPTSWKGHVAFVAGRDQHGRIMCVGGNQGDAVNVRAFSDSRVVNYRWPINTPDKPDYALPLLNSDGTVSGNEA